MRFYKPVKSSGDGTTVYTEEIYTQGGKGVPVTLGEPDEKGRKSLTIDAWMNTTPDQIASGRKAVTNAGIVEGTHVCPEAPALPALNNPADDAHILNGYEALNGAGGKMTGSHVCATIGDLTADATAAAADIASGKTAYVNGVKVTGTAAGVQTAKVRLYHSADMTIAYAFTYVDKNGVLTTHTYAGMGVNLTLEVMVNTVIVYGGDNRATLDTVWKNHTNFRVLEKTDTISKPTQTFLIVSPGEFTINLNTYYG